jgi:hypothetical protein
VGYDRAVSGTSTWARAARGACLGLAVALPVAAAVPVAERLGLQDLPQHLLVARLALAPASGVEPTGVGLSPYAALYALLGALGPDRVEPVGRGLVLLALLLAPIAAAVAAAESPRTSPRLAAVAAVPAATSLFFWSGFLNFVLAAPVLLLLLAAWLRLARSQRAVGPAVAVAACLALLWLLHPLAALAGALVSLLGAIAAVRAGGARSGPALGLTALALGLAAAALAPVVGAPRAGPEGGLVEALSSGLAPASLARQGRLLVTSGWFHLEPRRAAIAQLAWLLLVVGLALPWLSALRDRRSEASRAGRGPASVSRAGRPARDGWLLPAAAGLAALAAVALPFFVGPLAYAGPRFGLVALLGGAVAAARVPRATSRAGRRLALGLATAGALLASLVAADALLSVGREQGGAARLGELLAREPAPRRVLPLVLDTRSAAVPAFFDAGLHAADWALLVSGDADPHLFGNPLLPVRLSADALAAPGPLDAASYDPALHGRGATHVLLRLPVAGEADPAARRVLAALAQDFESIAGDGAWRLLRRR